MGGPENASKKMVYVSLWQAGKATCKAVKTDATVAHLLKGDRTPSFGDQAVAALGSERSALGMRRVLLVSAKGENAKRSGTQHLPRRSRRRRRNLL